MPYALIEDVQGMNARRTPYSTSTTPTREQVEGFITDISAEVDSALSAAGVFTPVSTPAAFVSALKRLTTYGAAALAEMAAFPEQDRGQASSSQGDRYWAMYQSGLKGLKDGSGINADAPTSSTSRLLTRSYGTDHPPDDGSGDPYPAPVISMTKVF